MHKPRGEAVDRLVFVPLVRDSTYAEEIDKFFAPLAVNSNIALAFDSLLIWLSQHISLLFSNMNHETGTRL